MIISGYVTGIDKWGRLVCLTPSSRLGRDIDGTDAKLAELKATGTSPVKKYEFFVRPDAKTLWMDEKKVRCKPQDMIQKIVRMNVTVVHYDFTSQGKGKGVSLSLVEAQILP